MKPERLATLRSRHLAHSAPPKRARIWTYNPLWKRANNSMDTGCQRASSVVAAQQHLRRN